MRKKRKGGRERWKEGKREGEMEARKERGQTEGRCEGRQHQSSQAVISQGIQFQSSHSSGHNPITSPPLSDRQCRLVVKYIGTKAKFKKF